jgi:Zn-dependent M28 family amino/carboxypeptidase
VGLAPEATIDRFDGARAFALLREQVGEYGWRPAGSSALRRLAVRLRGLLPRGRFEPIPGHPRLRNVVGSIPGRGPAIVVGAHYDVEAAPAGFVGANDGAAGTAAVVEIARALARAPRAAGDRAVRFVLFDGEEEPAGCQDFLACGLRGSKAYAKRHARELRSLVLLDYIAERRGLSFPREGGSDIDLWQQLRSAADAVGVGALFPDTIAGRILDDHTPFTDRGIPAIDVIDFDYPPRDTLADTLEKVSTRSLDAVGEAVLRLVGSLRRG